MKAHDWDDSPSDKYDLWEPGPGFEQVICSACNGSGEGMYDGSTCGVCGGDGEVWVEISELEEDDE